MIINDPPDIGLMLVRDPKECVQALCELTDEITLENYKEKYEEIKQLIKPIHIKNAHTHFYSLSIFGLIEPDAKAQKGVFNKTKEGKQICSHLKNGDISKAKEIFRYLLKNNFKKGKLFRDFENYMKIKNETSYKDIEFRYKEITAASLREWTAYAGITAYDKKAKRIWYVNNDKLIKIPLKKFIDQLISHYKKLQESEILGMDSIFVDINKIRTEMSLEFNISNEYWNKLMVDALNSKFGKKIRLYGSIPSEFEGKENFNYNNTHYALIRIKV